MKVLVIGGSYFLGRIFVSMYAREYDMTLVNRGNYTMNHLGVKEYHFDRHDILGWESIQDDFDVIIDFCAYQRGDIQTVVEHLKGTFQHYILISTVDVYKRQTGVYKKEDHPFEYQFLGGEIGNYVAHKVLLEHELQEVCQKYQKTYTALRPGLIYGPYNYAPRESLYIQRVIEGLPLFHIEEAKAKFQMVYVKDVAKAINLIIKCPKPFTAYNVVNEELTYDDINQVLIMQKDVPIINTSIQEAINQNYPLPYPLYEEEMELYDGTLIEQVGLTYTSLIDGMKETYQAFLPVYQKE